MSRRRRISSTNALATLVGLFVLCVIALFSTLVGANLGGIVPAASTATALLPPAETFLPPPDDTPVVILPTLDSPVGSWWEAYFTDPLLLNDPTQWQNSIEGRLIEKINAAVNSIHIAAFEFDLTRVAEALVAARIRGVDVRWVTDDEHGLEADEEPDRGQFAMLRQAGIEVRSDTRSALMHNKFLIFDSQSVWTGSTNISESAVFKQDNNALVIHSPAVAAMFEREFQEMWDGQFGPTSPSQLAEQSTNVGGTQIWVVFTSEDRALEQAIIPVVNIAQSSVRFLAFSYTDYPLANAMIGRAQSGVSVAGVYENVGSDTEAAEFRTLYCAGVAVRKDGNPSFMHNKVIVVDGRFVITGSMNFSTSAEESNDENVIILDSPEIASLYLQDFDRVWSRAVDPQPGSIPCQ